MNMMKWITFMIIILGVAFSFQLTAQPKKPDVDKKPSIYKKVTQYDFDTDLVEGSILKPEAGYIAALKDKSTGTLIKIRMNFITEMIKSIEDL